MSKSVHFAVAAFALSIAGGAFAQTAERNVFDTETNLRMPPAASAEGLTRDAVQAQYIAQRATQGIASFNPERAYFLQNNNSGPALMALFSRSSSKAPVASAGGVTREQVKAELMAARASGELNLFDTEASLRVPSSVRTLAPTAVAQR
jgi:hypothetical protein